MAEIVMPHKDELSDPFINEAIRLGVLCLETHCLPQAGGLLDQDSLHVLIIQAVQKGLTEARNRAEQRQASQAQARKGRS